MIPVRAADQAFWAEVSPSLRQPEGQDLAAYADALLARFQNKAIRHMLQQIAMDGSQKLPQRLLGTIRDNLAAGRPIGTLAIGVAAWICHVGRVGAAQRLAVNDPMAARFSAIAAACFGDTKALCRELFAIDSIFGRDLPADARFTGAVEAAVARLAAGEFPA